MADKAAAVAVASVVEKASVTAATWLVPCLSVMANDKRRAVRAVLAAAVVPIVAVITVVACTRTELAVRNSGSPSKVDMTGVGLVYV